jgi:hypothetical protein
MVISDCIYIYNNNDNNNDLNLLPFWTYKYIWYMRIPSDSHSQTWQWTAIRWFPQGTKKGMACMASWGFPSRVDTEGRFLKNRHSEDQYWPLLSIIYHGKYGYFMDWIFHWFDWFTTYYLVGGLEHEFYDFPFSWECHHPNWRAYFSEG